jgi:hypothetical protein
MASGDCIDRQSNEKSFEYKISKLLLLTPQSAG